MLLLFVEAAAQYLKHDGIQAAAGTNRTCQACQGSFLACQGFVADASAAKPTKMTPLASEAPREGTRNTSGEQQAKCTLAPREALLRQVFALLGNI